MRGRTSRGWRVSDTRRRHRWQALAIVAVALLMSEGCWSCGRPSARPLAPAQLRVGVAQLSATNPLFGVHQLAGLVSVEGLGRPTENGQMEPWLAESWVTTNGQRSVAVQLRSNVRFNDGSPFDAATAASLLPGVLRAFMGPVFCD